jgi:hypothetical protein
MNGNDGFPPTSRYAAVETTTMPAEDGGEIAYLKRRVVPAPESLVAIQQHVVIASDRLDVVTAQYLGDPEQFWQLCDANGAFEPAQLVAEPGARLRVALPQGVPGASQV